MEKTRLSSKGQVVLPKSVREAYHWRTGTEFAIESMPSGVLLRPVKNLPASRLEEVAGSLKYRGKPKTLKQMEAAIAAEVRARHARGRY